MCSVHFDACARSQAAHQRNAEGAAEDGAGDEPVEDWLPDAVVEALAERERYAQGPLIVKKCCHQRCNSPIRH